ncbi:MAG: hypothetical protein MK108_05600 [Mariniblastus sp.]|nr:hypothetical protein [Mariniblastus sp.]
MADPNHPPENPYAAAQVDLVPAQTSAGSEGDVTGGVIPYKNPCALAAYYLGLLAWIPACGSPFAIASIWLGIVGLKKRRINPAIRGSAHAIFGIVAGVVGLVLTMVILAAILVRVNQ